MACEPLLLVFEPDNFCVFVCHLILTNVSCVYAGEPRTSNKLSPVELVPKNRWRRLSSGSREKNTICGIVTLANRLLLTPWCTINVKLSKTVQFFPPTLEKKKKRKSVPVACAYSHLDWVVARKLCGPLPRNEGAELQLFPESSLNRLVQTISLEACCDPGGDPSCGPC